MKSDKQKAEELIKLTCQAEVEAANKYGFTGLAKYIKQKWNQLLRETKGEENEKED